MNSKLPVEAHLPEEILVRFLDGELGRRSYQRAARHLDSCWTCRSKREQLRKAMDRFVYLEEALIDINVTKPPRSWNLMRPERLPELLPELMYGTPRRSPTSFVPRQVVHALGVCG